jgi:hypothetical protein
MYTPIREASQAISSYIHHQKKMALGSSGYDQHVIGCPASPKVLLVTEMKIAINVE